MGNTLAPKGFSALVTRLVSTSQPTAGKAIAVLIDAGILAEVGYLRLI